jgi:hypothetical protein
MGLFKDVVEGFANGFATAAVDHANAARTHGHSAIGSGRIELLCRYIGWEIDERTSEGIALHFNEPAVGIRKVIVAQNADLVVLFSTDSTTRLPGHRVPIEVLGYLLTRNTQLAGCAWQASEMDNAGTVLFTLAYSALVEGLDPGAFKGICEAMVKEASEFDAKMRAAGLM